MSDKMRRRYGIVDSVESAVDPETVIEIGDLLWQDVDDAKPASMLLKELDLGRGPGTDAASLQEQFAARFLGVAMQRSRSGDTTPIRVATTGVFEFDCPSSTFELGDLVGILQYADGTDPELSGRLKLCNQKVTKVINSQYAIGRVAKREAIATTSVLVDIRSTVMTGGIKGSSRNGV